MKKVFDIATQSSFVLSFVGLFVLSWLQLNWLGAFKNAEVLLPAFTVLIRMSQGGAKVLEFF